MYETVSKLHDQLNNTFQIKIIELNTHMCLLKTPISIQINLDIHKGRYCKKNLLTPTIMHRQSKKKDHFKDC